MLPPDYLLVKMESGIVPDASDVDHLLRTRTGEGLYLDYKMGKLLASGADGAEKLRKAVAGFANADGGVLVIGVAGPDVSDSEYPPFTIDGAPLSVGGQTCEEWIASSLQPLTGYLDPQPRPYRVVMGDNKLVILLMVVRSHQLVPVRSARRAPTYYLRFGDGTHPAPEYLVADLVSGRRRRPTFRLKLITSAMGSDGQLDLVHRAVRGGQGYGRDGLRLRLSATVENAGLSWATGVRIGMVYAGAPPRKQPPPEVMNHVACPPIWMANLGHVTSFVEEGIPTHLRNMGGNLAPHSELLFTSEVLVPDPSRWQAAYEVWQADETRARGGKSGQSVPHVPNFVGPDLEVGLQIAAYVTSQEAAPMWFSGELRYSSLDSGRTRSTDLARSTDVIPVECNLYCHDPFRGSSRRAEFDQEGGFDLA